MNHKILILLIVAHCVAGFERCCAQTAQVRGRIVSRANKGIAGTSVKLVSSVDGSLNRVAETRLSDGDGNFRLPFDWAVVTEAIRRGAVWEVQAEKTDYLPARANVLLQPGTVPMEVTIKLSPAGEHDRLMSKVDGCANPDSDARTLYVFDFANDSLAPLKLSTFQQLLGFKLQTGVRTKLEEEGLLTDFPFTIKICREAPVRDEADAEFAGKRLGCPGVISGFLEERTNQLKSVVRFTVMGERTFTDFAPVVFSSDLDSLLQPSQEVNGAYIAFSAFVLGKLYLEAGRTNLATKCFLRAKAHQPGSITALQAEKILKALEQSSPARNLAPIANPHP